MNRSLTLLVALSSLTVAPLAWAGGGYFSGHKGARVAGRAGAFTARADDLSAVLYNPAGLGRLEQPTLQVGNRFTYNYSEYTRAPTLDWGGLVGGVPPRVEFAAVENETPWQLLEPFVGFATKFGLDDWTFALVTFAPSGVGRERFPLDGGQRYQMVSRDAQILVHSLTAAWKPSDQLAVGASFHWIDVAALEYALVIDATPLAGGFANPVRSGYDMLATVRGADHFTPNLVLGVSYRPVPRVEIGLALQVLPATIRTDSTLSIDPQSPSFEGDVILTRGRERADDVNLLLPLPLTARTGVRYRGLEDGVERGDIELDFVYETWSRVDKFRLDSRDITATLEGQSLDIGVIDIEKAWQDTVGVHLGGDYAVVPEALSLRAGASFESPFADPAYAHVDFASGAVVSGAVGASIFAGPVEVALALAHQRQLPVSVAEADARVYQEVPGSQCQPPYTDPDACHPEFLGQPSPEANAGDFRAYNHVAALDVLYRF